MDITGGGGHQRQPKLVFGQWLLARGKRNRVLIAIGPGPSAGFADAGLAPGRWELVDLYKDQAWELFCYESGVEGVVFNRLDTETRRQLLL